MNAMILEPKKRSQHDIKILIANYLGSLTEFAPFTNEGFYTSLQAGCKARTNLPKNCVI